jgi:hypothetical protein
VTVRVVVDGDVTGDAVAYDRDAPYEEDVEPVLEGKAVRRVRTPAGARLFGQPIGSVIVPDVVPLLPDAPGEPGYRKYPKHWWGYRDAVQRGASIEELRALANGNDDDDLLTALSTMREEGVLTDAQLGVGGELPPAGEAALAKATVKSVADLVAEGWDPEKAVKEHKRLVHNEAVRLIRLRQKAEKAAADAKAQDGEQPSSKLMAKLEELVPKKAVSSLDPKVLEDLELDDLDENPKALYSNVETGGKSGPGHVKGGQAWWRKLVKDTDADLQGSAIPVSNLRLDNVGRVVEHGVVVRRGGVAYLLETEGGTELTQQESARLLKAVETVESVLKYVPDDKRHYLGGVTLLRGSSPSDAYWAAKYDKPGFKANAQGGDGSINFWNSQDFLRPDPGTIAHEFGHNLDARALEDFSPDGTWLSAAGPKDAKLPGQTKDWGLARLDDAAIVQHLAKFDFVETRPGTHPIDFATTTGMSEYADASPQESFAEAVRLYLKDRREGKLGYLKGLDQKGKTSAYVPANPDRMTVRFADLWPSRAKILDAAFGVQSQYDTPYYKAKLGLARKDADEKLELFDAIDAPAFASKHAISLQDAVDIGVEAKLAKQEKEYQKYQEKVSLAKATAADALQQTLEDDGVALPTHYFVDPSLDDPGYGPLFDTAYQKFLALHAGAVDQDQAEAFQEAWMAQAGKLVKAAMMRRYEDALVEHWKKAHAVDPAAFEPPTYMMVTVGTTANDYGLPLADRQLASHAAVHRLQAWHDKLKAEQELVKSASEAAESAAAMLTDADLEKDTKKKLLKKKAAVKFYAKKGGASPEEAQKAADEYYAAAVAEALEQQGVNVATYKQADAGTTVSAGGEKMQPVHKVGSVTRAGAWLKKAGTAAHPKSKKVTTWWGQDQRAKDYIVTELSDRLNNEEDWEIFREYRSKADVFNGVGYGGPTKVDLKPFGEYTEEERLEILYDDVNNRIAKWAGTSGDSDVYALMMQHAVKDEFGLKADWGARMLAQGVGHGQAQEDLLKKVTTGYAVAGPFYRRFVRRMYEHTQAVLAAEGVKEVGLWRGMSTHGLPWGVEGKQRPPLQPANSWASSKSQAKKFLGSQTPRYLKATVPASRILGSARTGFGCLNETEFVVLDSDGLVEVIKPTGWSY